MERGDASQSAVRRVRLGLLLALGVGAVLEGGLQLAAASSARVAQVLSPGTPRTIPDVRLGQRPNPELPDHDEAGWRNVARPAQVAIVAIGDSQTYGEEVLRDEAWPQRVAARSGRPTYNLALGGYGPIHYERLLDEALALSPERVLVGLYSGNDLANAYAALVREGLAPEHAPPASERDALLALDARRGGLATAWRETKAARRGRLRSTLHALLLEPLDAHSRLYGLARGLIRLARTEQAAFAAGPRKPFAWHAARFADADPALLLPVGQGALGTVLTPKLRAVVIDPADPRVAFGERATLEALARMARRLPPGRLAIVGIPTKELVFAPLARSSGSALPPVYEALLRDETRFWERVDAFAAAHRIPVIPALPALRAALAAGRNPYPPDWNGHPNATGNDAIAEAVIASGASAQRTRAPSARAAGVHAPAQPTSGLVPSPRHPQGRRGDGRPG